jgi:hypothetical protein
MLITITAALSGLCATTPAQVLGERPPETPDMPYLEPGIQPRSTPAAAMGMIAISPLVRTLTQVNVDENAMNILGDAANEPSIAVDPTAPNRIAIGWRQFDTVESNFRQAGWGWTDDGGRTWTFPGVLEPGVFQSDPVLTSGPDGTLYYNSLSTSPMFMSEIYRSFDGGKTWDEPSFAFGGDKQWFAIDDTGGPNDGAMYQAWNVAGNPHFPAQYNFALPGTQGDDWQQPIEVPGMPSFGTITFDSDSNVYVAGAVNSAQSDTFFVSRATGPAEPGGMSFDQSTNVDMGGFLIIGDGPNPAGLLGQVWIHADRSGGPNEGNLYLAAPIRPPGVLFPDPMEAYFLKSTDGGLTWTDPKRLNDDAFFTGAWQWFVTMGIAPNGRIDVVFNDTRTTQDGPNAFNFSQLVYTASFDGGETWTPNEILTVKYDSLLGFPQQNKLGDYYHLVSDDVGADLAWAATFNGEQDVYYMRINDYDCNRNGIPDTDDIANGDASDCNANGIPDACEIAAGAVADDNNDGIPDDCTTPCADLDGSGTVDSADLNILLGDFAMGAAGDIDGDGQTTTTDLNILLFQFAGPCP